MPQITLFPSHRRTREALWLRRRPQPKPPEPLARARQVRSFVPQLPRRGPCATHRDRDARSSLSSQDPGDECQRTLTNVMSSSTTRARIAGSPALPERRGPVPGTLMGRRGAPPAAAGRASSGQRRQLLGGRAPPGVRGAARRRTTKKFCHRLYPWAPPVAELSPSRLRFRPPIALTFAFRLRPSRSASTYSRPVLDAGRTLRPARASFKGGQERIMRKFSLFANFSFFHISTAIRATCG
jgi:hypothetical protein